MTVAITHTFVSAIPDDADATLVRPSNWNATHTLTGITAFAETYLDDTTQGATRTTLGVGTGDGPTFASLVITAGATYGGAVTPASNDGAALGTTALQWSDLFLASGALIDFANGNARITHSSGILTVSTGDLRVTTAGTNSASVVTVGGTQTLTAKTLTSPTIGTSPTAAGATWTDLGSVTTADINGGTIDGATIGASSPAAATATTLAADNLVMPPQGRLTLQTGVPVMVTTQSGKTTLFYTAYAGNYVPIYNGTRFTMTPITGGEISVLTTDTSKSPAAIGASKVNDWFIWNDAGTIRLGHGPDWTSDTARSAGTALVLVNGIYLNNASITNGPAASRGTYVGTTRSNASSQLDWIFGAAAAGGTAGFLGVWNAYNRVQVSTTVMDSTASWTYNSTTWRNANNSATNRVSFVRGLNEDSVTATYSTTSNVATVSGDILTGIGLDSATPPGVTTYSNSTAPVAGIAPYSDVPGLGLHYLQAAEKQLATGAVATLYGNNGSQIQGLVVTLRQ